MIIDLTTKISHQQMNRWLEKEENKHIVSGHIGTHLDVYNKSDIPLEYFKRQGVLVDVVNIAEEREIEVEDLKDYIIKKGSFVLFYTGRINKYEYGTSEYFNNHPQLSNDLIDYLISKEVSFIGIDCSGIRQENEHYDADVLCENNNIYVIENLCNLNKITNSDFMVYTMWQDDESMTGLKTKVIAEFK